MFRCRGAPVKRCTYQTIYPKPYITDGNPHVAARVRTLCAYFSLGTANISVLAREAPRHIRDGFPYHFPLPPVLILAEFLLSQMLT